MTAFPRSAYAVKAKSAESEQAVSGRWSVSLPSTGDLGTKLGDSVSITCTESKHAFVFPAKSEPSTRMRVVPTLNRLSDVSAISHVPVYSSSAQSSRMNFHAFMSLLSPKKSSSDWKSVSSSGFRINSPPRYEHAPASAATTTGPPGHSGGPASGLGAAPSAAGSRLAASAPTSEGLRGCAGESSREICGGGVDASVANSRGQSCRLQGIVSHVLPHCAPSVPPCSGCTITARPRVCVPPPHEREH